jgi:hypothetical protein
VEELGRPAEPSCPHQTEDQLRPDKIIRQPVHGLRLSAEVDDAVGEDVSVDSSVNAIGGAGPLRQLVHYREAGWRGRWPLITMTDCRCLCWCIVRRSVRLMWAPVAERLTARGQESIVPLLLDVADEGAPFWPRVVDDVAAATSRLHRDRKGGWWGTATPARSSAGRHARCPVCARLAVHRRGTARAGRCAASP